MLVSTALAYQQSAVNTIGAEKLKQLQNEGIVVIDVRTREEYEKGHIPGSVNINFYAEDFVEKILEYIDQAVILHCAVGGRSNAAAKMLLKEGFVEVYDYSGGFSDWKRLGEQID